ncbi:MAG TPA: 4-hydroxy-tetrahydrodipicolinate synthase [Caulobacterales bacterium]|nr:4-hydroxy-tetrahydrodipicolinate synthase [Caulobacterales bacterium]
MFRGSITALITPFRGGMVDEKAFAALVEAQIEAGIHGLVPCGTTGESPTLSHEEHRKVVKLCVEVAARRVPVIAGAGSNSTAETIGLVQFAKEVGADAALCVAGYYNKPSQEGLYQHFKALTDAVALPVFLYNIPGRTIVDIGVETMGRIAKLPHIVGVKDATGDLGRVPRQREACGPDFIQLSGNDDSQVGFNAQGGRGCISVTANVAPALTAQMQEASLRGDYKTAREIDDRLADLHRALFLEPSPGGAKYACSLLGLCAPDVRLPILSPSEGVKEQIRKAMARAGLNA